MQLRSFSHKPFLSCLIRKFGGGGGPEGQIFFLKSVQNSERSRENLKKWEVNFFPTIH
jgi:hypothetical protein